MSICSSTPQHEGYTNSSSLEGDVKVRKCHAMLFLRTCMSRKWMFCKAQLCSFIHSLPWNVWFTLFFLLLCIAQIEASTSPPPPPGKRRAFDTFAVPGRREFDYQSSREWGIWSPCFRGGECELHLRFHVKSLAWRGEPSWGKRCWRIFVEKIVPLWPIGYEERA